jgi:sulfur carrier protein ThiS
MPEVRIAALGAVRKLVGFSQREVAFEGETVADLLRSLQTREGGNLYNNLVCEGHLRGDYAVMVNGLSLRADQLEMHLKGGEQIVTLAILRHLAGG